QTSGHPAPENGNTDPITRTDHSRTEPVDPGSVGEDSAQAAIAKIIDTSGIYKDMFRRLQFGPAFQVGKWSQDQDLFGGKKLAAEAMKGVFPSGLAGYAAGLRSMDQLAGRERMQYLKTTARLSESVIGPGTTSAWRTSLQLENAISQMIKGPSFRVSTPKWAVEEFRKSLAATSRRQVYMTDWLAQIDSGRSLLSEISSRPLSLYRDYVVGLGESPTRTQISSSLYTGQGVNGLLGADVLSLDPPARFVSEPFPTSCLCWSVSLFQPHADAW
ncbi:hypothetical protein ACFW9I_35860, partial [[Kitasatospora] papulosa]|uniref:hypothetical protein n=1 Tax=[Kitasatospora] papulosa TaxID=1464011 RepID=UPI0036A97E09